MSHNVETMAYAGETPWHGLGVRVSNDLTPREMQKAAGLDWEPKKVPDYIYITDADGSPRMVPTGRNTLIRDSDNTILTHGVGDGWNECPNNVAFDVFDDVVRKGGMEMHTAGSLQNGKIVWVLAKTLDGFSLAGKDDVEGYFLFTNPHIYGRSVSALMTSVRVVCNNTLDFAHWLGAKSAVRINHSRPFDTDHVKAMLGLSHKGLETYKEQAEFLANKRATTEDVVAYFAELFPSTAKTKEDEEKEEAEVKYSHAAKLAFEVLETQPGAEIAQGSWWQAFNAVTYICDHRLGHSQDTRLNSTWFGVNRKRKADAIELAMDYAKAA